MNSFIPFVGVCELYESTKWQVVQFDLTHPTDPIIRWLMNAKTTVPPYRGTSSIRKRHYP